MLLQEDSERSKEWRQVLDASVQVLQQQLELHPNTGEVSLVLVLMFCYRSPLHGSNMRPGFAAAAAFKHRWSFLASVF